MVQNGCSVAKTPKEIGYFLGTSQGAFTANSPCQSPKQKPFIGTVWPLWKNPPFPG